MQYSNIILYFFLIIGIFKEVHSFTFYLNKNNYQYYYYQLNNVERNIYNAIINNLDYIIQEKKYVVFNTTNLIQSSRSGHFSEYSTYQSLYLVFEKQLEEFRNYFINAKYAARYDYPELSFIDWDALDIDYGSNGKLILIHKEKIIEIDNSVLNTNNSANESIRYKKSYKYLYKSLSSTINNKDSLSNFMNQQTEFIYYDIIKDAFVDVPIIVTDEYYWSVSSLNYGINTIINNIIENIYKKVKEFDYDRIIYGKKNITDPVYFNRNADEIYGLMQSGYATPMNLAKSFKSAMDYIGIECVLIWGKTFKDNHSVNQSEMWNYIKLYDKWYSIDLAFNYYDTINLGTKNKIKRGLNPNNFFNRSKLKKEKREEEIINNNKNNNNNNSYNDERKIVKKDSPPYTLYGSKTIYSYLIEDSTIFTTEDSFFAFPKLYQQDYELYMVPKITENQYNITKLNELQTTEKNINNVNMKDKLLDENQVNLDKRKTENYNMFVNTKIKTVEFKMNNKDLLENIILSYDIYSENFDVNSMSYLLVKRVKETQKVKLYKNVELLKREKTKKKRVKYKNDNDGINSYYTIRNMNKKGIEEEEEEEEDNNNNNNVYFYHNNDYFTTINLSSIYNSSINKKNIKNNEHNINNNITNTFNDNNNNNDDEDDDNYSYSNMQINPLEYTDNNKDPSLLVSEKIINPSEYTYVTINKDYTTYQFIPGHSFININKEFTTNQYITFYIISNPISYWYNIFGENFSIGTEGYEEVIENGEIKVKKYNDWTKFLNKYNKKFEILYQSKYNYFDTSLPLTQYASSFNYKKSSPLPNYYINLRASNVTICYHQPLIEYDELSMEITYSLLTPILNGTETKAVYTYNNLKFNSDSNCIEFEFIPDLSLSNIIYYFQINGLYDKNFLAPASFSYIIYPNQDHEFQRNVFYQTVLTDISPISKVSYCIPYDTFDTEAFLFYDTQNNVFYKNDIKISSKPIQKEIKTKLGNILKQKEKSYNEKAINTEFLAEFDIKATTGVTLKAISPFELLIPWSNQFKKYNYDTYKCYSFNKDNDGNPKNISNCSLKFFTHGVITRIRSLQYIWIISFKSESSTVSDALKNKSYTISYSIYKNVIEGNDLSISSTNINSVEENLNYNIVIESKVTNKTNSNNINNYRNVRKFTNIYNDNNNNNNYNNEEEKEENDDDDDYDYIINNYNKKQKDICKTLDILYKKKLNGLNSSPINIIINGEYNCYFDLKHRYYYYCFNKKTNEIISRVKGKCYIEQRGDDKNNSQIKKMKIKEEGKRDSSLLFNDNSDIVMNLQKVTDIETSIPNVGMENTLIYFSVVSPSNYGIKEISIKKKKTGEVMFNSSSNKKVIECISINQSYRFLMPSYPIELSIEFASNNLKVEYIIIEDYKINIIEGKYTYYAVIKDKSDITEKPIVIKTENLYVTYTISYFILKEEIYITFIAPNNEYLSYTIRYISKYDDEDQSSVSMLYIQKKPVQPYIYNSYVFIYCNPDPEIAYQDLIDKISIKDLGTATLSSDVQGNKILVKITAENKYNYTLYTIVPINKEDETYPLFCMTSLIDNDLNSEKENNNDNSDNHSSFSFSLKFNYLNNNNIPK
ncbi:hypothetical protein BCR32DRAFT_295725 [Anaeromyces robustus]|uniref:Transglutaminase-like domain-containing protein n=1 Tax=Anaeromyces robustus TaxID=1754192 RepID=A0A1Y1WV13_9FUNG|nr:hypothetical protein BCR32DRAFT_295725 [Anaeromyces robustus]|eukprot:ORX77245.1 hypothetical protein BCR32DRAFT_295725 [Anaeromyces robustus]